MYSQRTIQRYVIVVTYSRDSGIWQWFNSINAFSITSPSRGKSIGDRWIPFTKGQQCVTLVFSLLLTRTTYWTNRWVTGKLRRRDIHMISVVQSVTWCVINFQSRHVSLLCLSNYLAERNNLSQKVKVDMLISSVRSVSQKLHPYLTKAKLRVELSNMKWFNGFNMCYPKLFNQGGIKEKFILLWLILSLFERRDWKTRILHAARRDLACCQFVNSLYEKKGIPSRRHNTETLSTSMAL